MKSFSPTTPSSFQIQSLLSFERLVRFQTGFVSHLLFAFQEVEPEVSLFEEGKVLVGREVGRWYAVAAEGGGERGQGQWGV